MSVGVNDLHSTAFLPIENPQNLLGGEQEINRVSEAHLKNEPHQGWKIAREKR